jgi:hypothetical protein
MKDHLMHIGHNNDNRVLLIEEDEEKKSFFIKGHWAEKINNYWIEATKRKSFFNLINTGDNLWLILTWKEEGFEPFCVKGCEEKDSCYSIKFFSKSPDQNPHIALAFNAMYNCVHVSTYMLGQFLDIKENFRYEFQSDPPLLTIALA